MNLPVALVLSVRSVQQQFEPAGTEAAVEIARPRRTVAVRASVARGLIRAAKVIAPA